VHLLILAASCALAVAGSASAQSALNMGGTISPTCTAFSMTNPTVNLRNISSTTSPGALNTAAVNVTLSSTAPSITCNGGGTTLSINADPLTGPALPLGAPSSFSNIVDYTATINKSGTGAFVQSIPTAGIANATTSTTPTSATVGLVDSSFTIALSGAVAGGVLIAGGYNGTLTIALTPG
jgi:hypothetical protein